MTNQTDSPAVRRWLGRATCLAGVTLLLSLSTGPAAHADGLLGDVTGNGGLLGDVTGDGGLLGEVTEVVGGVTEPVVQPVVQTVQTVHSAVPQPVQQAVQPTVSQVVEPAVSHVEQAVKAVKGTEQAAAPVVEAVKPEVRQPEEPVERPQAEAPARVVKSAPASSTPAPSAPQAPVAGGPTRSPVVDASGHKAAKPAGAATRDRGDDRRPSAVGHRANVADLAPRAMAGDAAVQPVVAPDPSSDSTLWSLTNALMRMWAGDAAPGSVNAGLPGDRATNAAALGTFGMAPLLLALLMGCVSLALGRRLRA